MRESNGEDKKERSITVGYSRPDSIVLAATSVASVGAANLLNLQPAQGADAMNPVAIRRLPIAGQGTL